MSEKHYGTLAKERDELLKKSDCLETLFKARDAECDELHLKVEDLEAKIILSALPDQVAINAAQAERDELKKAWDRALAGRNELIKERDDLKAEVEKLKEKVKGTITLTDDDEITIENVLFYHCKLVQYPDRSVRIVEAMSRAFEVLKEAELEEGACSS